ncbi:phosphoglycerate kinase [Candidatus Kaiserbacteria bacterium CG10_big_fil_rev_8_21_14_0_10_44_10]|uniref:Phosphoglycerate kinase n=1 Tax=Candidatus Kaiserbacteria bacterium CG10_big_fil_rev_8_21_14_0_10_44_10 TaxID=1974606 RepID=A0A2H0UGQ5_9BACT|nr:MAG: phosphoglycerate kinase [Candidatus Kaiserbacteria bacterium CG10_big_fil_rev_8_21_14_0_10_44_10]
MTMLDLFKFFSTRKEVTSDTQVLPSIKYIKDLKGKRVLLRASLNAPVENGKVTETFRLEQAVESIEFLKNAGARVVVIAHIGREKDESLEPVSEALSLLTPIKWGGELSQASEKVSRLENGEAILLENLRQDSREVENDESLAKELSQFGDLYINDAFSDSHREHASIVGVPKHLPSYFGFSFLREYNALLKVMEPKHPAVFILGGAKFETKLPLVTRYARIYDKLFIGGALVHDILKAQGYEIGKSLVSDVDLTGNPILEVENISVPSDVVVTDGVKRREVGVLAVLPEEYIYDAGPQTLKELEQLTRDAKTILWNGPLGNFEKGFSFGTETLARMIASSSAYSVVGGGDTIAAIRSLGLQSRFGFLSTAGGAMLVFLETGTLPAIKAVVSK